MFAVEHVTNEFLRIHGPVRSDFDSTVAIADLNGDIGVPLREPHADRLCENSDGAPASQSDSESLKKRAHLVGGRRRGE